MPDYRLSTDDGEVVETASHSDDRAAIAWRAAHPFLTPSPEHSRQLTLQKQVDGTWTEIGPLGAADAD